MTFYAQYKNCKFNFCFRLLRDVVVLLQSLHIICECISNGQDGIEYERKLHSPQYWLDKTDDRDAILMTNDEIKSFNNNLLRSEQTVKNPLDISDVLNRSTLIELIDSVSSIPQSNRYYSNGQQLTQNNFECYKQNLDISSVRDINTVRFGVVVHRSAMRTFPTENRVFNEKMDLEIDRFQESAVFPGEIVTVYHSSLDKQWYLVQNYNQLAWVKTNAIALCSKQDAQHYNGDLFIVTIGAKIFMSSANDLQLDMGTRLPLNQDGVQINSTFFSVKIPERNVHGNLIVSSKVLAKDADLCVGYLPFTKSNLMKQSFKFLGERYGWGHDFNSRDCTGFVGDVYKTFGIEMPRNSEQQGHGAYGINFRFQGNSSNDDKLIRIKTLEIGDLIYIPGHVMMFIGNDDFDMPCVIHDVKGIGLLTSDGIFYRRPLNSVSVTPLISLYLSPKVTVLDHIYNIKRIRATE